MVANCLFHSPSLLGFLLGAEQCTEMKANTNVAGIVRTEELCNVLF